MGKVLRTAAAVVGAVVAVAAAIPSGGTSLLVAGLGVTGASVAAGAAIGLNFLVGLTAKRPSPSAVGEVTTFRSDDYVGMQYYLSG